jgi:hypothetical protein
MSLLALACLLGCFNGTDIHVNPMLPSPIFDYVEMHELCHAEGSNLTLARRSLVYLYGEELRCHSVALRWVYERSAKLDIH